MLTRRQRSIIEIMINNYKGITGSSIAIKLCVSDRTIRNDIYLINENLKEYNCFISSSNKKGYYIEENNLETIKTIALGFSDVNNIEIDNVNRLYIILGLILFNGKQNINELEDILFVSEQTIYKDIIEIQKLTNDMLKQNVIFFSNGIVYASNDECLCRKLLYSIVKDQLYLKNDLFHHFIILLVKEHYNKNILKDILSFVKKNQKLMLNDTSLYLITWLLYITVIRNRIGYTLNGLFAKKVIDNSFLEMLYKFRKKESDFYSEDIHYLTTFLWTINGLSNEISDFQNKELSTKITNEYFSEVRDKYGFDFFEAISLMEQMNAHINYMLRRLDQGFELNNPIITNLREKYILSYEMAMLIVPIVYKHKNKFLLEGELSYIAIYNEHYLQNHYKKLSVLLTSDIGYGVISLVQNWIVLNFSNQLEVKAVLPFHMQQEFLDNNKVDLIITTAGNTIKTHIPIYTIQIIPDEDNKLQIDKLLKDIRAGHKLSKTIKSKFDKSLIKIYNLKQNFNHIISDLSALLQKNGNIDDANEFANAVLEREKYYPTLMPTGFMLPHPLTCSANRSAVAVAILKEPIKYLNGEARLIFLLATEPKNDKEMNSLFALFKYIGREKSFLKLLVESTDINDFINNLIIISKGDIL